MKHFESALKERKENHLYRQRRIVESPAGTTTIVNGKELLNFCSNDYLGLANDPRVNQAFIEGIKKYGTGSGAAHLISGHTSAHHELEEALADFTGRSRALLFSTGVMANQGVMSALLNRHDTVFEDKYNHASLLDAATLSRAKLSRYAHLDLEHLDQQLAKVGTENNRLIATDSIFSMDGDHVNLVDLSKIATKHRAWLMVDDAHGFGVLGEHGSGSCSHYHLNETEAPILMATLGKAVGCFGAFVAGSEALIETLIQQAGSYIYTTASPPAMAVATLKSLEIIKEEDWRRERLQELISIFKEEVSGLGLNLMPSDTAIQPILTGTTEMALTWARYLENKGFLVTAIRPPTVPKEGARLRITLSANHTDDQLYQLIDTLAGLVWT